MLVARETMRRVRSNCLVLNDRLEALGFDTVFVLGDPTPPPILDELERRFGVLPIALRAFFEVVGDIECVDPPAGLEPLGVASASDIVDTRPRVMIGASYVELPEPRADAPMLFDGSPLYVDGRRLTFVRYLRHALQCGGFLSFLPGSIGQRLPPSDVAQLTRELLPI